MIRHALHHVVGGQLVHARERLAGTVAGGWRAVNLYRAEEVVMRNHRRARALCHSHQIVERNHLAGVGAHVVTVQVACIHAERLVGLHEDTIGAVVVIEVVDVLRAHEDVERGGNLRERDAHRLGFLAVDGDQLLRVVGGKSREQLGQFLMRSTGCHQLVRHAIQIAEGVSALVLQHELKSAEAADA